MRVHTKTGRRGVSHTPAHGSTAMFVIPQNGSMQLTPTRKRKTRTVGATTCGNLLGCPQEIAFCLAMMGIGQLCGIILEFPYFRYINRFETVRWSISILTR